MRNLLADPAAGLATKQELLKNEQGALQHSQKTAEEEFQSITEAAYDKAEQALEESKEERCGERNWWPEKLRDLLPRLRALVAKGHLVNGPTLAWEALEGVVYYSICDYRGQECYVGGREEECDWFHDQVDRLALRIFVEMRQHHQESESVSKRQKTIKGWQKRAEDAEIRAKDKSAFRTQRYKRSLHFLKTGEILPEVSQGKAARV